MDYEAGYKNRSIYFMKKNALLIKLFGGRAMDQRRARQPRQRDYPETAQEHRAKLMKMAEDNRKARAVFAEAGYDV